MAKEEVKVADITKVSAENIEEVINNGSTVTEDVAKAAAEKIAKQRKEELTERHIDVTLKSEYTRLATYLSMKKTDSRRSRSRLSKTDPVGEKYVPSPSSIRKNRRPVRWFLHFSRGKCAPKACTQTLAKTRKRDLSPFFDMIRPAPEGAGLGVENFILRSRWPGFPAPHGL